MSLLERVHLPRAPEKFSSHILYPFVLRKYNSYSIVAHGLEHAKNYKPVLKTNGVLFVARRMNIENQYRLRETLNDEKIYNPVKEFYPIPIVIVEEKSFFDYYDSATNFRLKKGDPYLSIHFGRRKNPKRKLFELITRKRQLSGITNQHIVDAMTKIADYVSTNREKLPPRPIVGITYDQLAKVSEKYGFTVAKDSLPQEVKVNFMKAIKKDRKRGKIKDVKLCFQSYDDLKARFKSAS